MFLPSASFLNCHDAEVSRNVFESVTESFLEPFFHEMFFGVPQMFLEWCHYSIFLLAAGRFDSFLIIILCTGLRKIKKTAREVSLFCKPEGN